MPPIIPFPEALCCSFCGYYQQQQTSCCSLTHKWIFFPDIRPSFCPYEQAYYKRLLGV